MLSGGQEGRLMGMFYGSEVSISLSLQTRRPTGLRAILNVEAEQPAQIPRPELDYCLSLF